MYSKHGNVFKLHKHYAFFFILHTFYSKFYSFFPFDLHFSVGFAVLHTFPMNSLHRHDQVSLGFSKQWVYYYAESKVHIHLVVLVINVYKTFNFIHVFTFFLFETILLAKMVNHITHLLKNLWLACYSLIDWFVVFMPYR